MGIADKIIPHYTYDDWVHWEGKWELIEGHPIAMSPTPVPAHQRVAAELRTELLLSLRKVNCKKCRVYDPVDYKISNDTILVPDVLIICGEIKKKYLDFSLMEIQNLHTFIYPPNLIIKYTLSLGQNTAFQNSNSFIVMPA